MRTGETVRLKVLICVLFFAILCIAAYSYRNKLVYSSISLSISDDRVVEYGTDYDALAMVNDVSGSVSILKNVNTSVVGEQVLLLQIKKENVKKHVPITIEVVDSVVPTIEIKDSVIYLNSGKEFDINSNIINVSDNVDGELDYCYDGDLNGCYTVTSSINTNSVGSYTVDVKAIDSSDNVTNASYTVIVTSHGKEYSLRNVAYSLIGKPYVFGGNTLAGFDCSGFVQYVYARNGMSVGKTATAQYYNGYEVNYNNIRVGDIIIWGYGTDKITHTSIYVGDGLMIHAANPYEGVVVNRVLGWGDYTGVHIVSVRRLA